ncbi:transposable element Tcb2 transposase [Trichonephila clavipes]|nr:transposable element Tcb2 transposase [Trichonephila clavipes]
MTGKLEERCSLTCVDEEFGINNSVVSCTWKAFQTIGTADRKVGGGLPRKADVVDDRCIVLQAKRAQYQLASVIAQQLSTATGRQVPQFTVARLTQVTYLSTVLNAAFLGKLTNSGPF